MQYRENQTLQNRKNKKRTNKRRDYDSESSKHFERKMQVLTSKSKQNKYKRYDEEDI